MASINATPHLSWIDLYSSDTTLPSGLQIGQLEAGSNGKVFRYSKVGATALVVGSMYQGPAISTDWNDLAVAVVGTAGNSYVDLTLGSTATTANIFDGGTLEVSVNSASGTNLGDEYTILGHAVAASGTCRFQLDRPIRTTMTVSTTSVTLRKSPWAGIVITPQTTLTATVAGVAIYAAASTTYCWVQTLGVAAVLSDATSIIAGSAVASPSTYAAGEMTLGTGALPTIGMAMRAAASGKTIPVQLVID
jgi:hypothetical protein